MGSLTLPSAGTVYLDTDAVIYSVEKFVTNDHAYRRAPGLPVTLLDDVLASP